ncbi:MAG: DUF2304 domain-containing protein [Thermoanaerobaculia bacterium]
MTPFQIVAIAALAVVLAISVAAIARKRVTPLVGVFWVGVWLAGAVAIGWPDVTVTLARALGINRGADLVSYLAILAMLAGFFALNLRIRRMESQITTIVQELALRSENDADGDS